MAFKVCIAWAVSALALMVSSAIASSYKISSTLPHLPNSVLATDEGIDAEEHEQTNEPDSEAD
jgi:hypothetical protein